MEKKKNLTSSHPSEDITATADAGGSLDMTLFTSTDEDEWTEADAKAFIDELVARNKEALRGLAKL